ncbi:MAG: hypothetical protein ACOC0U_05820 [Desulfovibrionales bacterium]
MTLTPQIIAGVSSLAGALLFFVAGFFLARLRAAPEVSSEETTGPSPARVEGSPDKIEMLENQLRTISQQRRQGLKRIEELQQVNDRQKEENKAIIAAAKNRMSSLKQQKEKAVSEAEEQRSAVEKLTRQLEEASPDKENWKEEKEELATALHMAREDLKAREEELERLSDIEEKNRDLSLKAELLNEQLRDLQTIQEENQSLKAQLGELDSLHKELERLKKENSRLQSLGIVLKEPPAKPKISPSTESLGQAYQDVVSKLSQDDSSRGVVMADELGLLIAGTGDHMEAMAAMAAVYSNVSNRIESMLPFGEIEQVVIENTEKLTITMQPYVVDADRVIITALTVGPGPTREYVTQVVKESASSK